MVTLGVKKIFYINLKTITAPFILCPGKKRARVLCGRVFCLLLSIYAVTIKAR